DSYPDSVPVIGYLVFRFSPAYFLVASASPPITIIPEDIIVELDDTGAFSVDLIATDNDNLNPTDWTYYVIPQFVIPKDAASYPIYSIQVPTGDTVDLALAAPIAASN